MPPPFPDNVLHWNADQKLRGFRDYRSIFPTRVIPAGRRPSPLPERPRDLSHVRYDVDGQTFDLGSFKERNRVVGLLVLHDGAIVLEEYGLGNGPTTRWATFSVTKSIVSLLMGAAVEDGLIEVDDLVTDYLPALAGSSYEGVAIRHTLQMASGVEWNEDYQDPGADVSREVGHTSAERLRYLASLSRAAPPGTRFNYSTGESHLVAEVLRAAVGTDLSTYLAAKIWQPFGMASDADWLLVEPEGAEHGGSGISATLRDCARVGLFALGGGLLPDGRRVLPRGWMADSTAPSPASDQYGYLWWRRGDGAYGASGIFGQAIHIDPAEQLVIVTHSAWPGPRDPDSSAHRDALFRSLTMAIR